MSIIEDALKKAQKVRAKGETTPPDLPPAFPPHDRVGSERSSRTRMFGWIIFVVLMVGVGGAAWWGLDVYQKGQRDKLSRHFSPSPAPLGGGDDLLPSLDNETTAESAPVEETTASLAPAELTSEELSPAELPIEDEPVDLPVVADETDVAVATPAIVPPEPRQTPFAAEVAGEKMETGDRFVGEGWTTLTKRGDAPSALTIWEEGLSQAPDQRLAFVVSVYTLRVAALKKAREVGAERYALVVKGVYQKKPAYYLLAYPPDDELFDVQKSIIKRLKLKGLKGNRLIDLRRKIGLGGAPVEEASPVTTAKAEPAPVVKTTSEPTPTPAPPKEEKKELERRWSGSPSATVEEGARLVRSGAYEKAVALMTPLFATPPADWETYAVMGSAHLGAGRLELAEDYFNRGLARDARQATLWVKLGVVAQQRGENLTALKRLEEARRIAPESPEVWLNIGYSSDVIEDREGAAFAYRKFLVHSEGRPEYLRLRTRVVERLGAIER